MTREDFIERLDGLYESDIVYLWNEYCAKNNYYENYIEYMDGLNEACYGMSAFEIIEMYGSLDTSCEYYINGCYGCESFDDPTNYIDYDDLANYMINNDDDLGSDLVGEWLEELKEDEDDDVPSGYKM